MSIARHDILMRLEDALTIAPAPGGLTPPGAPTPLLTAAAVPLTGGGADWKRLQAELKGVRAEMELVSTRAQAHKALRTLVREQRVASAARWRHPRLERLGLDKVLRAAGVTLLDETENSPCCGLRDADLGVTAADAVFLDTGAIALRSGPGRPRAVSLLPRIHLAVIELEDVLPGLCHWPELVRKLSEGKDGAPSALYLVTGPSGTADIELVYTQGAHGPLALRALVLAPGWDKTEK